MKTKRFLEIGGLVAGVVLIVFGAAAIYMGVDGRSTVRDSIQQEQIFFGEASDPAVAQYAPQWADAQVQAATRRAPSPRSCASTRWSRAAA